jgi:hypothetical protein
MEIKRSNVRAVSNVQCRGNPHESVSRDHDFLAQLRTRDAILAALPELRANYGIDWQLARSVLSEFQLQVLEDQFRCGCGRLDRFPVWISGRWKLSLAPRGCLCARQLRE